MSVSFEHDKEFTVVRSQSNSAHLGVVGGESHVMVIEPKCLRKVSITMLNLDHKELRYF